MSGADRVAKDAGVEQLRTLAGQVRPVTLARARILPVREPLAGLLPDGGLRRGSTVSVAGRDGAMRVDGQGTSSLTLALVASASAAGSWCAVVSWPDLGLVAAAEAGLILERVALIPVVPASQWSAVVAALIDAVDVVVACPPLNLRVGEARRLSARARERGAIILAAAPGAGISSHPWPEGVDVALTVSSGRWEGPGKGEGYLRARCVEVTVGGRRAAARERRAWQWLPAPFTAPGSLTNLPGTIEQSAPERAVVEPDLAAASVG